MYWGWVESVVLVLILFLVRLYGYPRRCVLRCIECSVYLVN